MGIATFPEVHHAASLPLAEKVVLVTGGSRGIGRAIALELCERGATVALNYHHSRALAENVCEELIHSGARCEVFQGDVSDRIQARKVVQEVVDHFHHLDVLVNNAGITRDHSFRKMTDEEWLEVIETNLNSVFYCSSAALPGMMERNYGRIVNIASFVGQAGNFGQANYAASKGGVIAMTKALALEVAKYNITVNAIAPGFTGTDMVAAIPGDIQAQLKARIPMHRFAEPEEIAKAVAFLVCEGDYITGQQINVNGGLYM